MPTRNWFTNLINGIVGEGPPDHLEQEIRDYERHIEERRQEQLRIDAEAQQARIRELQEQHIEYMRHLAERDHARMNAAWGVFRQQVVLPITGANDITFGTRNEDTLFDIDRDLMFEWDNRVVAQTTPTRNDDWTQLTETQYKDMVEDAKPPSQVTIGCFNLDFKLKANRGRLNDNRSRK